MKDISERAFPKGHFDEGHFEGRAFPKGERAKGMKGIVHKLEFPPCCCSINRNIIVGKQAVIYVGWDQVPERVRLWQVKVGLKSDFWQRVPNKC